MSYVKWILGGAAIVVCTVIAYKLSEKFRLRQKFYNDFYLFNKRMCDEMSFTRNSLLSVLASFDAQTPFQRLLNEYRRSLAERTPFSCAEIWFLKEEEKRLRIFRGARKNGRAHADEFSENLRRQSENFGGRRAVGQEKIRRHVYQTRLAYGDSRSDPHFVKNGETVWISIYSSK